MYSLKYQLSFEKALSNLIKKNPPLREKVRKMLKSMTNNPFTTSLKSHKVSSKNHGISWSSYLTADLRIIWKFDEEENSLVILLLDVGGHSGGNKVYK